MTVYRDEIQTQTVRLLREAADSIEDGNGELWHQRVKIHTPREMASSVEIEVEVTGDTDLVDSALDCATEYTID